MLSTLRLLRPRLVNELMRKCLFLFSPIDKNSLKHTRRIKISRTKPLQVSHPGGYFKIFSTPQACQMLVLSTDFQVGNIAMEKTIIRTYKLLALESKGAIGDVVLEG